MDATLFVKGHVYLLVDGRMFMFEDWLSTDKEMARVTWMHKEDGYVDLTREMLERALGDSPAVVTSFMGTRSIHLRLNNLKV